MAGEITLPEITIEGSAGGSPQNAADWWAEGFLTGYNAPHAAPERPLMINDELAGTFLAGVESGRAAARTIAAEMKALVAGNPQIGPDIGGQSLESVRAQFLRDFGSLFNSEQELHTHDEAHELMEPLPTPNIVLVE